MATGEPVRLRLSRTKGFRLHQTSFAANGRECRRVDRTTVFGNPFRYQDMRTNLSISTDEETSAPTTAAELVALFRHWLDAEAAGQAIKARAIAELRGFNLACWCALEKPCHADVLLEIANA